jgi:hypothetical protein
MTKNKIIVLTLTLLGFVADIAAQEKPTKEYIILSFEREFVVSKMSPHGVQSYYWIIPLDSIKSYRYSVYHLFINGFSKRNLDDCCNGKEVDPFLVFSNEQKSNDTSNYLALDQLHAIIKKNKKELLSVTKKWKTGSKENIRVFATPVSGKFCSSNFHLFGQKRYGYKGKVYIPYSSFNFLQGFWSSQYSKFVINRDFSKIEFDIIPY